MKKVTVYMRPTCPYCQKACFLLDDKGVKYETINISADPDRRPEMIEKANGNTTVPQIFIGDYHVGGCDELLALDEAQKLDKLLVA